MASQEVKRQRIQTEADGSVGTASPRSLLFLCIHFVADHLMMVDSLVGLPEEIGEAIFRESESEKKFTLSISDCDVLYGMNLFTEAYGDVVLSGLSVSGCHIGLNYCEDYLKLFLHLCELDISDCGLGDDHEILSHIGHMNELTKLSLRRNNLTDTGIQKMTSPYRVLGRGPGQLVDINISENEGISNKSVIKCLSSFYHLTTIDVTGSRVKSNKELLQMWKFVPVKVGMVTEIVTKGWAKDVVNEWLKTATTKPSSPCSLHQDTAKRFYSHRQKQEFTGCNVSKGLNCEKGYRLLLKRIHTKKPLTKTKDRKSTDFMSLFTCEDERDFVTTDEKCMESDLTSQDNKRIYEMDNSEKDIMMQYNSQLTTQRKYKL